VLSQNCERRLLASSCLYVRPSARMEQLDSNRADFHEIWYSIIFRKYREKIKFSLKYDNNNGYFTWNAKYIVGNISLNSF
jgi:hypothetical protein